MASGHLLPSLPFSELSLCTNCDGYRNLRRESPLPLLTFALCPPDCSCPKSRRTSYSVSVNPMYNSLTAVPVGSTRRSTATSAPPGCYGPAALPHRLHESHMTRWAPVKTAENTSGYYPLQLAFTHKKHE